MTRHTAIVILGASVWQDGPSPTLVRRTRHGAALYRAGRGDIIIPCGGIGRHPPSEAAAMQGLLLAESIPPDRIHTEDQSTSTYENLRNARAILRDRQIDRIVIVTDRYHGPRALMVAKALGLSGGYDTPTNPNVAFKLRLRRLIHEAVALPAYACRLPYWLWRDSRS